MFLGRVQSEYHSRSASLHSCMFSEITTAATEAWAQQQPFALPSCAHDGTLRLRKRKRQRNRPGKSRRHEPELSTIGLGIIGGTLQTIRHRNRGHQHHEPQRLHHRDRPALRLCCAGQSLQSISSGWASCDACGGRSGSTSRTPSLKRCRLGGIEGCEGGGLSLDQGTSRRSRTAAGLRLAGSQHRQEEGAGPILVPSHCLVQRRAQEVRPARTGL